MTSIAPSAEPMLDRSERETVRPAALSRVQLVLLTLLMALAFWLPRAFQLDHYVTIDEKRWLTRSANFIEALTSGELQNTFQQGHPGVTVMWLGAAGYEWRFPEYARLTPGQYDSKEDELEDFLKAQGHPALEILSAGRVLVVAANTLFFAGAFLMALRLLGLWPALIGFLLIAFDPFAAAFARYLHPDALLPGPMLLSVLALLAYFLRGRRPADLIISGLAAGFAWLTKTPGMFLMPFAALVGVGWWVGGVRCQVSGVKWWRVLGALVVWGLIGGGVFVLFWPALWVAPVETVRQVLAISSEYAEEGHSNAIFFNGTVINGDPGLTFYPINFLWRATPSMLVGLALALIALIAPGWLRRDRSAWLTTLVLLAFGVLFMAFMNIGAKKFDRYILPVFPVLDLAAGVGIAAVGRWLLAAGRRSGTLARQQPTANSQQPISNGWLGGAIAIATLAIVGQAALALPTFPYYLSYYNPLLGGSERAPEVMFVGWGEGVDQAARYLNERAQERGGAPADLRVATWYGRGPLSYFFDGTSLSSEDYWMADYAVTYQNQWQREVPARQLVAYLDRQPPEESIAFDGIEYARIYNMDEMPLPDFVVDWGNAIRLVSYELTTGSLAAGQPLRLELHLQNLAPIDRNLNMLVRVVDAAGHELLRNDGWPYGSATSNWQPGELWIDRYKVDVPAETPPGIYRVEIAFYEPDSLDRWPVTRAATGDLLGDMHVLDYVLIGEPAAAQAEPLEPVAQLGDVAQLRGFELRSGEGTPLPPDASIAPGESVRVRLQWRATGLSPTDYTTFVQLLSPDGQVAAQQDNPPLDGFIPMRLWYPGLALADEYVLALPPDAAPGDYPLYVGLYELSDGTRLPVTRGGEAAGDAILLTTVHVNGGD